MQENAIETDNTSNHKVIRYIGFLRDTIVPSLNASVCAAVADYIRATTLYGIGHYSFLAREPPFRKCTVSAKSIRKSRRFPRVMHSLHIPTMTPR
jgi:hypothetical protein